MFCTLWHELHDFLLTLLRIQVEQRNESETEFYNPIVKPFYLRVCRIAFQWTSVWQGSAHAMTDLALVLHQLNIGAFNIIR